MKKINAIIFTSVILFTVVATHGIAFPIEKHHNESVSCQSNSHIESHLIKGVPCIGQDTRFYCTISSQTMILNYYNYNFSKYEVLYLMGGGFSLLYRPSRFLIPYSSVGCSFRPSNYDYVASLLGLEFEPFNIDLTESDDKIWDSVWSCLKQNISQDRPVMVNLDLLPLFAAHNGIDISKQLWDHIPLRADHAIVVVGFNETNQSICYNDPSYSILGNETKGSYIWVNINSFKISFSRFTHLSSFFPSTYRIITYQKPNNVTYIKEEILATIYDRNIKRLTGNYQYYVSDIDFPNSYNLTANYSYGINASKELKQLFGGTVKNQLITIRQYKSYYNLGIKNMLFTFLERFTQRVFKKDISYILDLTIPDYKNIYRWITEEKLIVSQVLHNISYLSPKYEICSQLLKQEAENWSKIAAHNKILMNKGVFITIPRALMILHNMEKIMDDIIHIEEEIILLDDMAF